MAKKKMLVYLFSLNCLSLFVSDAYATTASMRGQLEVIHTDDFEKKQGSVRHYLIDKVTHERLLIRGKGKLSDNLLSGDEVEVKGQKKNSTIEEAEVTLVYAPGTGSGNGSNSTTTTTTATSTLGAQKTLFVLLRHENAVERSITPSQFLSSYAKSANSFFVENSYNQTSLDSEAVGWLTIPDTCTKSALYQISTSCVDPLIESTYNLSLSNYRFVFYLLANGGTGGVATVGGKRAVSGDNSSSPGEFSQHTINHELGHLFGLPHSAAMKCSFDASGGCAYQATSNFFDTMGYGSYIGHFQSVFKARLGWLAGGGSSPPIPELSQSGTYVLSPYESLSAEAKAFKVLRDTDPNTGGKVWYYIENRQPLGFDSFLSTISEFSYSYASVRPGLSIVLAVDSNRTTAALFVDKKATLYAKALSDDWSIYPEIETYRKYTLELAEGKRFVDREAKIIIENQGTSPTTLATTVKVIKGQLPPEVQVIAPASGKIVVAPSTSVPVEVAVTPGTAGIAAVNFVYQGNVLCRVQAFPFRCNILSDSAVDVIKRIQIVAEDINGLRSDAKVITISTDKTVPLLSLTPLTSTQLTPGTSISLRYTSSDNLQVAYYEFYVNGVLITRNFPTTYVSWKVPSYITNGEYRLKIRVYDESGNFSESETSGYVGAGGPVTFIGPTATVVANYYLSEGITIYPYTLQTMSASATVPENSSSDQYLNFIDSFNSADYVAFSAKPEVTTSLHFFVLRSASLIALTTKARDSSGIFGPSSAPMTVNVRTESSSTTSTKTKGRKN